MTDQRKDGGPAFPPTHDTKTHESGMSLRDWFAGQALAGLVVAKPDRNVSKSQYAEMAYAHADAMLTAREEGGDA